MGYSIYRVAKRDNPGDYRFGGYGVPTICEHPDCNEEIDRGMSFACGDEPFSEYGCDRYFCSKHKHYTYFDPEQDDGRCHHEDDCDCETRNVCDRCAKGEAPFDYKPEHPTWIRHLLRDGSWAEWRKENPDRVEELRKQITI